MNLDIDNLRQQIPYYLTAEDQEVLARELRAFASGSPGNYFLSDYNNKFRDIMLQGDGWTPFDVFIFNTGERKSVRGLVLSNSCDVSTENRRDVAVKVTFAPLVELAAYKWLLDASPLGEEAVEAKIASIKAQRTTSMFYLPAGGPLKEDHIVRFDDLHSMPIGSDRAQKKLFTLSNFGFYLLVLKLSVHFCRLQENVNRNAATAAS